MIPMIQPIFCLARHGRTNGNELNIYRGWSNEHFAQLNAAGREDAREAGLYLKGTGIQFGFIIVDDLERTQETAKIIAGILGIKTIITDKRLRPLNVGDYTGKSKEQNPLEEYLNNRGKKIPGGESLSQFDRRQSLIFADITETVAQLKKPGLVIAHGSNASYLYHAINKGGKEVGYEGMTNPGGVMLFTKDGLTPIFKKREGSPSLYQDGTETSGFVTAEQNRPPRECWNCRNFVSINDLGACTHILVRIDPKLQDRKQTDGTIAVGERDCCNLYRNKVAT